MTCFPNPGGYNHHFCLQWLRRGQWRLLQFCFMTPRPPNIPNLFMFNMSLLRHRHLHRSHSQHAHYHFLGQKTGWFAETCQYMSTCTGSRVQRTHPHTHTELRFSKQSSMWQQQKKNIESICTCRSSFLISLDFVTSNRRKINRSICCTKTWISLLFTTRHAFIFKTAQIRGCSACKVSTRAQHLIPMCLIF